MTTAPSTDADSLARRLIAGTESDPSYATEVVDGLLHAALAERASDVHLAPTADGLDIRWRIDGVLQPVVVLPRSVAAKVVSRLKVLADLLTYRTDVPQEGRVRGSAGEVEMRLSTFPTLHGEKAVVRVFPGSGLYQRLDELGFPAEIRESLRRALQATAGAIVFSGPAGSGKTTTLYACLRELEATTNGRRCLTSLEDPIEVAVPGVAQSQVNPQAGFTLAVGLRSLLRQDPEVIAIGEIRDRETAEVAFQASLTGHLVLTTFHAGSAAGVVGRLSDMGIEPYMLRSGLLAVVAQRLARRLCDCARTGSDPADALDLNVDHFKLALGCERCGQTGYRGRLLIAEMLVPTPSELGRAILSREDVARLEELAATGGMVTCLDRARRAVEDGLTSPAEVRRILGDDPVQRQSCRRA
jgi:type II secretory ATPase GspE/PulE/Tfp pilus assembly ATPase PilB-like protein